MARLRILDDNRIGADKGGWRFYSAATLHIASRFVYELHRTITAVHPLPLVAALMLALALSEIGQLRELYIGLIEGLRLWWLGKEAWTFAHTLFAVGSLSLFSALIYIVNQGLGAHRIRAVFFDRYSAIVDPRLSGWVRTSGLFAATLPWIGLLSGVAQAVKTAREHIQNIIGSQGSLSGEDDTGANFYFGGTLEVPNVGLGELKDIYDWIDPLSHALDYVTPAIWPWDKVGLFWQLVGAWTLLAMGVGLVMWIFRDVVAGLAGHRGAGYLAATIASSDYLGRGWNRFWDAARRFKNITLRTAQIGLRRVTVLLIVLLVLGNFAIPPIAEFFGRPGPAHDDTLTIAQRLEVVLPHGWAAWVGTFWPGWTAIHNSWPIVSWLPSPIAVWWAVGGVLFAILAGFKFFATFRPFHGRLRLELRALLLLVRGLAIAAFCLTALSGFMEFYWVDISRAFGPLATAILVSLVLFACLAGLSHVARQTEIPFFAVLAVTGLVILLNEFEFAQALAWTAVSLTVIGIMYQIMRLRMAAWVTLAVAAAAGFGAWKHAHSGPPEPPKPNEQMAAAKRADLKPLAAAFDEWLKPRNPEGFRQRFGRQYPVFIVAAEGGGIYAASAAATFLARMQDTCPNFAQHLFAVSGVSGGAVGATVFHGAVHARQKQFAEEGCDLPTNSTPAKQSQPPLLQDEVAWVLRQDHLSPILGLIVPDVVGVYSDRAQGLEDSLKLWMNRQLEPVGPWNQPYSQHWDVNKPAPALVLNTTWVRVGNRVVFAPFNLDRPEFVTLNTFEELAHKWKWSEKPNHQSGDKLNLTEAAVVSARFPGIVAAYEMRNSEQKRWHFVDGGYVDASGAITAREIYETIKTSPRIGEIDLRVILLTSTQNKLNDQGTDRGEPAAPVVTLFTVRSLLSRIAVRETINKLSAGNASRSTTAVDAISNLEHPSQKGDPYLEKGEPWPVSIIELNHEDFRLELGWKISKLTNDVVSLQLGQPGLCDLARVRDAWQPRSTLLTRVPERRNDEKIADAKRIAKTIRANSCVMRAMVKLLRGEAN